MATNVPTQTEDWDWVHRYETDTLRPVPGEHDIDNEWVVKESLVNPDGGFNGGIDLVTKIVGFQYAIRKRLISRPDCAKYDSQRWKREMLILRKLRHPNIPFYIDGFYTPAKGSIYMQACRLGSLADFFDSGRFMTISPVKCEYFLWYVLYEIATAILYLQTGFKNLADANSSSRPKVKGWVSIVHGDIRPDQIFIHNTVSDTRPRALLGDFGFGQFLKPWAPTDSHDGPGSKSRSKAPEFPEEISTATDIFGLGATAQLCIRPREHVKKGLKAGLLSSDISANQISCKRFFDELICSCVCTSPAERTTIREFLTLLEEEHHESGEYGRWAVDLRKLPLSEMFKALYPPWGW